MPHRFSTHPLISALTALAFSGLLALGVGCGGGGSGGSSGSADTGSVAVLVTDGPVDPDEFSHIYLTFTGITLIGPDGQVSIFDGEETIDLREIEDASTLVTLGRDVPARPYEKIRLDVTEIELVPADGGEPIFPKLPPKIDLNPRETFHVQPGELLIVQIDVDAGKSIHVVERGNGGFNFRPVIFVDILSGPLDGRLVLLRGVVEEVGDSEFLLCRTHPVSQPLGNARVMMGARDDDDVGEDDDDDEVEDNDGDDREDFCIDVEVDGDTSFFDEDGDPAEFADLMPDDPAWVLGRFVRDGDEHLDFAAEVVQLGDDVLAVDGEAASEVGADDRFDLELDPGQGIVTDDGLLPIQLQDGTKLFRRSGEAIEPEDIEIGDPARAVGVLALSSSTPDALKAAWVVLDIAATQLDRIEGEISAIAGGGSILSVQTDTEKECVNVADARVFAVHDSESGASAEEIDRTKLMVGDEVNLFGSEGGTCFTANTVIVFFEDVSPNAI